MFNRFNIAVFSSSFNGLVTIHIFLITGIYVLSFSPQITPMLERKVLYLSFVENARLNDICKRLKLQKKQVISLKQKGILHFKNNLQTLIKAENLKGGKR